MQDLNDVAENSHKQRRYKIKSKMSVSGGAEFEINQPKALLGNY